MMDPDKRLLMQFRFNHLPTHLQSVSRPFYSTAEWLIQNTPGSPERTLALRKLFEAKNYAVMGVILAIEEKDATAGD